jgi:hypothetical protein
VHDFKRSVVKERDLRYYEMPLLQITSTCTHLLPNIT